MHLGTGRVMKRRRASAGAGASTAASTAAAEAEDAGVGPESDSESVGGAEGRDVKRARTATAPEDAFEGIALRKVQDAFVVYKGDVVSLCARIKSLCSKFNLPLVAEARGVTQTVWEKLPRDARLGWARQEFEATAVCRVHAALVVNPFLVWTILPTNDDGTACAWGGVGWGGWASRAHPQ